MTDIATARQTTRFAHLTDAQVIGRLSTGTLAALIADDAGALSVSTSPSGTAWGTPVALPAPGPLAGGPHAVVWSGDAFHLWTAAAAAVQHLTYAVSPATGAVTLAAQQSISLNGLGITAGGPVSAQFDGTWWTIAFAYGVSSASGVNVAVMSILPAATSYASWNVFGTNPSSLSALALRRAPGGFLYVTYRDATQNALKMQPVVIDSAGTLTINRAALETPYASAQLGADVACYVEPDGTATWVVSLAGALYGIARRTANTYSQPVPLNVAQSSASAPRLARDPSTGALVCITEATNNQPNGEVYAAVRSSGAWQAPKLLAGGDAQGYHAPAIETAAAANGTLDLVYTRGSGAGEVAAYGLYSNAGPPSPPQIVSPVGSITDPTPALCAVYANPSPTDPQGGRQWQITAQTGGALLWDSGDVATAAECLDYPSGAPALSYDTGYIALVRDRDAVSNSGAGTYGSWSQPSVFTLRQGGTVTIASVSSHGLTSTASPWDLPAPSLAAHVTWDQPQGHSISGYRSRLMSQDGSAIVVQSPWSTLDPVIAAGGAFDTTLWSPQGLLDGATYQLIIDVSDATTGAVSSSDPFILNAVWVGPNPPTGFTVTVDPDNGWSILRWTNADPTTAWNEVWLQIKRDSGQYGPLQLVDSGHLWTWLVDPTPMGRVVRYSLAAVAANGLKSTFVTQDVWLPPRAGKYGWWLNAVSDWQNTKAAVGAMDSLPDNSERQGQMEATEERAKGASVPRVVFARTKWFIWPNQKWAIPRGTERDSTGNIIYGEDVRDAIETMWGSHMLCLFRDQRGGRHFVTLWDYVDRMLDAHWGDQVEFALHQTRYPGMVPVTGGP